MPVASKWSRETAFPGRHSLPGRGNSPRAGSLRIQTVATDRSIDRGYHRKSIEWG